MNTQKYYEIKEKCFDKIYSFLNDRQKEALKTVNGPLLVVAGAGSGKTTVLVNRIAGIIRYGTAYQSTNIPYGIADQDIIEMENALSMEVEDLAQYMTKYAENPCPAWAIMCITFTNKAANEMKERLSLVIGEEAQEIWAGTFHNICMRILRKNPAQAGLAPGFTIYDTDDTKKLINSIVKDFNLDDKRYAAKTVINKISRAKESMLTPDDYEKEFGKEFFEKNISRIYREYQKRMHDANAVDFDDIIVRTVNLLNTNEEIRNYYQRRFKYICIDEYQDTNKAQFLLALALCGKYRNIMVVGDDDQSIYRFRGATIENILNFDKHFTEAKIVKLEQNYRSTKNIIETANHLISNNRGRREKNLWTAAEEGEKVKVKQLNDQTEEARYIADSILDHTVKYGSRFSDHAILYRVNAQSNGLENVFAKSGIPYRILGGTRFYERKEIKDIIAYLCLVCSTGDNLRLKRIINEPKRKIGDTTVDAVERLAQMEGVSMFEILENANNYTALSRVADKLKSFAKLINDLREIEKTETLSSLVEKTIDMSTYRSMLISQGQAAEDRLQNVEELISNAVAFEESHEEATLAQFLEEAALVADIDNYDDTADAVVMMTIHSAKGLEFNNVYLPGLEEGLFPSFQSIGEQAELEEERRLCYVAITRAKKELCATYVKNRLMFGHTQYNPPSRFLGELPKATVEHIPLPKRDTSSFSSYSGGYSSGYKSSFNSTSPFAKPKPKSVSYASNPFAKPTPASSVKLSPGDEVSHIKYGKGMVLSVTDMSGDYLYEVAFDNFGTKKMMASFAKLKRL
ncbi:MAG: UvrD-helicase domain-containing protein [Clostridia bacterium]|nr:UvrD-helicase domain-containing protein [Clostridia bacterium]